MYSIACRNISKGDPWIASVGAVLPRAAGQGRQVAHQLMSHFRPWSDFCLEAHEEADPCITL